MRPTYDQELEVLAQTYESGLDGDLSDLRRVVARMGSGPATFIASGGMSAVATLASQLHEQACLEPGSSITPLAAIYRPPLTASGAMLFTSSGKHPDAQEVMRRLGRPGMHPGAIVTHRREEDLPDLPDVAIVTLPPLHIREGFLAVNSVLSMCVALIRGYLGDVLPPALKEVEGAPLPAELDRLLVLYPPSLECAGVDIETRLVEIGLASVQATDFRNFAHGRHTGLARNASRTAVLILSDAESLELADATAKVLPTELSVTRWNSELSWPESAIAHLVRSMEECGAIGRANQVNVGKPQVPVYGRRLYRLPIRRKLPERVAGPIERKLRGVGGLSLAVDLRTSYENSLIKWLDELARRRFGAVALDYDGTVCATHRRFYAPSAELVQILVDLLEQGLRLGFASGRGPSLPEELRRVLPEELWPLVEVGIYNGGVLCTLDQELENLKSPSPLISAAQERLEDLPIADSLNLTARREQLTVEIEEGMWLKEGLLMELVADQLLRTPSLGVKIVASAHSVDVVPPDSSKVSVIRRLKGAVGLLDVLSIGDQGQVGGNDFEMLAEDQWSLSVDRTSADPTRCWFLGNGSKGGPDLLHRYLKAIVPSRDGFRFKTKRVT